MSSSSPLQITTRKPLSSSQTSIPILGFGVYQSHGPTCTNSVLAALRAGYRHIDTAQFYQNESEVGAALTSASQTLGIPRASVFVTTKIMTAAGTHAETVKKCLASIAAIDPDTEARRGYVDLFLIHSTQKSVGARKALWLALEELKREGRARAIGVSNYGVKHVEEMKGYTAAKPDCNQIELHPWAQQREIVAYCEENQIAITAYCPLRRGYNFSDQKLLSVVSHYEGKTPAQILLRYSLQKGWIPLPKSDDEARIKENADVFGWELSVEDMATLDAFDSRGGYIVQAVDNE